MNGNIFFADFETVVTDEGKEQEYTEVWAAAIVQIYTEDVKVFGNIKDFMKHVYTLPTSTILFHNLKFDGSFIIDHILKEGKIKPGFLPTQKNKFKPKTKLINGEYSALISDRGQWYAITIKKNNKIYTIWDSSKLLPSSVERLGKSFKTKHRKTSIDYIGFRYANCYISPEELKYIKNDVLVVKECYEVMIKGGNFGITIGSACMKRFKEMTGKQTFYELFPDIYTRGFESGESYGDWIFRTYKGAWCYLVEGKENKVKHNGITLDVTSLYPSQMHSVSGNKFPIGTPKEFYGKPDLSILKSKVWFIHIRTRFKLKDGYLPFIQIKNSKYYRKTDMLHTSDFKINGKYYKEVYDKADNIVQAKADLYLTCADYELLLEHYDLYDTEYLEGLYFNCISGIFDKYIEYYKEIKDNSEGALREIAKYFLNNLYGKFATRTDSSYKVPFLRPDGIVGFETIEEHDKTPGYIPVGSMITSYARCFTIRAAQKNYYGVDKPGFIYADTDSLHLDLSIDKIKGVIIHENNLCTWKNEAEWEEAIFIRQKTYIEIVKGKVNITCAGMQDRCKKLLEYSINETYYQEHKSEEDEHIISKLNEDQIDFIKQKRTLRDFKVGLQIPGALKAKRVRGGVILYDDIFTLQEKVNLRFL